MSDAKPPRRSEPPSGYPPNFREWPRADQLDHMDLRYTREGLIVGCLSHAGFDLSEYQVRKDSKLRKKELAGIYLTLEGY